MVGPKRSSIKKEYIYIYKNLEYKFSAETADVEKYYIVFNVATLVYIYLYSYIV